MENLSIWNKLKAPPKDALRTIEGGRLKGMTDINPQWRIEAMTEQFGPCGVGWKDEIVKFWEIQADTELLCFAQINLYIKVDGKWSDAIPGTGGSKLLEKEKNGMHSSDEGYKMAYTDALSVAMKKIGVASDVYRGKWDGTKYKVEQQKEKTDSAPAEDNVKQSYVTPPFIRELYDIAKESGAVLQDVISVVKSKFPTRINPEGDKILFHSMSKEEYWILRQLFEQDKWKEIVNPGLF